MATRYPVRYPESGDVLEPKDLNINHGELAGEINGFIDRDNLPEAVTTEGMTVARTGSNLRTDPYTATLTTLSNSLDWHADNGSGTYVGRITFTSSEPALLDCDFGVEWDWDTSGHAASYELANNNLNCIRFRIVVDGLTVAEGGFNEEGYDQDHTFITGTVPIDAGSHVIEAQYQKVYVTNYTSLDGSALACVLGDRELLVHQRTR